MLTFLIVMAVMAVVFWMDLGVFSRGKEVRVIVFYSVIMALSTVILGLHCFEIIYLPEVWR